MAINPSRSDIEALSHDLHKLVDNLDATEHGELIYNSLKAIAQISQADTERLDWKILTGSLQDMQKAIADFNQETEKNLSIRIGIHTGLVVAGVIGLKKFACDLWGDTVNTASRMESHGIAGKIQVSEATYDRLKKNYNFEEGGAITIKGKGEMITYLLLGQKNSESEKF